MYIDELGLSFDYIYLWLFDLSTNHSVVLSYPGEISKTDTSVFMCVLFVFCLCFVCLFVGVFVCVCLLFVCVFFNCQLNLNIKNTYLSANEPKINPPIVKPRKNTDCAKPGTTDLEQTKSNWKETENIKQ